MHKQCIFSFHRRQVRYPEPLKLLTNTMATGDPSNAAAYFRCHKALHLVTKESVSCVDNCLKNWHGRVINSHSLQPCAGNCGKHKKDWCSPCEEWGKLIESSWYHQPPGPTGPGPPAKLSKTTQPMWSNVNSCNFSKSHIEVAKAFVFRLPSTLPVPGSSTNVANYTKIADFDSGSLLCIMTRFNAFHSGDPAKYEIIKKVSNRIILELKRS